MRIISGKLKGRVIKGYDIEGTRPTMDRVKESIFGMIQSYLDNSVVLDLFCGSGNLGIESISNGASIVYFNDYNKKCTELIKKNLEDFKVIENSFITNLDYQDALNYYKNKNIKFDLIFLDPPYQKHIVGNILKTIIDNNLLNTNGLVICEVNNVIEFINEKLILLKKKTYGDKVVLIYKYDN